MIRGHETLRHLSNKKKVSSLHLSSDNRFALKIISKSHMKVLSWSPLWYFHSLLYGSVPFSAHIGCFI